jgi:hypothetical protein
MLNLAAIQSQCQAHGRIKQVFWLEPAKVVSMPRQKPDGTLTGPVVLMPTELPKRIHHVRDGASFQAQEDTRAKAGDWIRSTLTVKVTATNTTLEAALWRIHESRVHVFFVDHHDAVRWMPFASVSHNHDIRAGRGDRNEYTLTFITQTLAPLGIIEDDPFVMDIEGGYWALPDGSPWTDASGDAWIFD